ncbi:MAG TPA: hypothetical protein VNU94_10195 [Acidobacteriaceae bacterium]|jgi:hypothetical protein|nr:hypothetical protein [Acidobacteriaceae bacterium]
MNLGLENKKKAIWAGSLGGVALLFFIWQLSGFFTSSTPPPPAAPVIKTLSTTNTHEPAAMPSPGGRNAEPIANTAAQLDPTLRMEGMNDAESLVYGGSGRNIFSTQSAPPPIPKAIAPARPKGPPPPPPVYVPPPPPPIQLQFFGTEAQKDGSKRAFLVNGDDVFLAAPGDIVERRYKILNILPNGVVIHDLPNNDTQTVNLSQ